MTIRFQATGEKHVIESYYEGEKGYRIWITRCNQRCVFMVNIGTMPVIPERKDCEECYDSRRS